MLNSLPVFAQHTSCHLAHVHHRRAPSPFHSLPVACKQSQHPRLPLLPRRQGEVLLAPTVRQVDNGLQPGRAVQPGKLGETLLWLFTQ